MAEQTKQALKVENNTSFPNNNTGYITPALLREFNTDMIDSTVNQIGYNVDSSSWNEQIAALDPSGSASSIVALNEFTASIQGTNAFTASATISINALNAFTSSVTATATGSLLTTASFSGNTMTFTKGDGSTFGVVIPDVSGSTNTALNQATASLQAFTASVAGTNAFTASIAGTNAFTQSAQQSINALNSASSSYAISSSVAAVDAAQQLQINSLIANSGSGDNTALNAFTASIAGTNAFTASIKTTNTFTASAQLEINALEAFTSSVLGTNAFTASIKNTNAFTQSAQLEINALEAFTASVAGTNAFTASALTTASANLNVITFTKGNGTTFAVTVNTGSGGGGTTDISALNAFTASVAGTNTFTQSAQLEINALEAFTASIYNTNPWTASINTWTSSTNARLNSIENTTASLQNQINLISGSGTAISVDALNSFTASIQQTNAFTQSAKLELAALEAFTASVAGTNAFTQSAQLEINSLEAATASLNTSVSSLNAFTASVAGTNTFTQSASSRLNSLEATTASLNNSVSTLNTFSASALTTASVNLNTITFTKGDASTFNITVNTGSGGGGTTDITALNAFTASVAGTNTFTASAQQSINALNGATSSYVRYNTQGTGYISTTNYINADRFTGTSSGIEYIKIHNNGGRPTISTYVGDESLDILSSDLLTLNSNGTPTGPQPDRGKVAISSTNNKVELTGTTIQVNSPLNISSSAFVRDSFTASLQSGYAWVGDGNGYSIAVATSSFAGGASVDTGSLLTTASFATGNTITFTKGNGSTFGINNVPRLNGNGFQTFDSNTNNVFSGSTYFANSGQNIYIANGVGIFAGSENWYTSGSIFLNGTNKDLALNTITSLGATPQYPASSRTITINANVNITGSLTASLQSGYAWVGNASGRAVAVATSSFAGTAVDISALNAFSASTNLFTQSAQLEINSLEGFTASVAGTNAFTQSAAVSIAALNAATSSYITSAVTASMAVSSSLYAVTASLARELIISAQNANQSTLPIGTVVRISGANGDNPQFNTASYTDELQSSNTLGVVANTAVSGQYADITVIGKLVGINTDGMTAGDLLYLGATGSFTNVQPQAPLNIVVLGEVLRVQSNNGSMFVNISNGWELNELHNVRIVNPLQGDVLVYEASSSLWKNQPSSSVTPTDISALNAFTASIAGTNAFTASTLLRLDSIESKTGSFATTGSNAFVGNQTITGTLQVSSSATYDIDVTGSIQATTAMRVTGSTGVGLLQNNLLSITSGSYSTVINRGAIINQLSLAGSQKYISIAADPSNLGALFPTLASVTSPSIISQGPAGTSYYAPIRLEGSSSYTDGRVTITTPLVAQSGSIVSGSLLVSGTVGISGSAISFVSGTLSGSVITNIGDTYTDVAPVNRIITLTSASYAALASGSTTDPNALYIVSGSLGGTPTGPVLVGNNNFVGNQTITGSLILSSSLPTELQVIGDTQITGSLTLSSSAAIELNVVGGTQISGSTTITGSVNGNVTALSITSNTASLDFNAGNLFTLTLVSGSIPTRIEPTNIKAGQTISLVVTQAASLSGSLAFPTTFKFPYGFAYTSSVTSSAVDVLTFVTVNTSTIYASAVKNLV